MLLYLWSRLYQLKAASERRSLTMTSDPVGTISAEARRRGIPEAEINLIPEGLRELGYVAGQNIIVDYRYAAGNVARLHPLASKLVQLKVAVLVAR
jgi:hypothetical protein